MKTISLRKNVLKRIYGGGGRYASLNSVVGGIETEPSHHLNYEEQMAKLGRYLHSFRIRRMVRPGRQWSDLSIYYSLPTYRHHQELTATKMAADITYPKTLSNSVDSCGTHRRDYPEWRHLHAVERQADHNDTVSCQSRP